MEITDKYLETLLAHPSYEPDGATGRRLAMALRLSRDTRKRLAHERDEARAALAAANERAERAEAERDAAIAGADHMRPVHEAAMDF